MAGSRVLNGGERYITVSRFLQEASQRYRFNTGYLHMLCRLSGTKHFLKPKCIKLEWLSKDNLSSPPLALVIYRQVKN